MRALVTGGLGFVGAIVAKRMLEAGHEVLIVDDGRDSVGQHLFGSKNLIRKPIESSDIGDEISSFKPVVILHFAASAAVGDGEVAPVEYAKNNVGALACFLSSIRRWAPDAHFVHSGSCAVYGAPKVLPVDEKHSTALVSWYGKTKLMAEELVIRASGISGFRYLAFRYFNAVGTAYGIVERREREERLIPLAVLAARNGNSFRINGVDHPTQDGTCVRDYIHVLDLADAHLLGAEKLVAVDSPTANQIVNLGSGIGTSVLEVLSVVEEVSGKRILKTVEQARAGDVAIAVASIKKAGRMLGWIPRRTLRQAVEDVWKAFGN